MVSTVSCTQEEGQAAEEGAPEAGELFFARAPINSDEQAVRAVFAAHGEVHRRCIHEKMQRVTVGGVRTVLQKASWHGSFCLMHQPVRHAACPHAEFVIQIKPTAVRLHLSLACSSTCCPGQEGGDLQRLQGRGQQGLWAGHHDHKGGCRSSHDCHRREDADAGQQLTTQL